ncbi:MAG: hypothetical protein WAU68_08155 [Vitreimonas sp.]
MVSKYGRSQMILSLPGANSKLAAMRMRKDFAGRLDGAVAEIEWAAVRASEPELDQHRVVVVGDGDDLVALIRERRARERKIAADGGFAVEHHAIAVHFIARVFEGGDHRIPVVRDL